MDEVKAQAPGGVQIGSLCPQCGYDVKVDEDGCCISCGGYSIGPGADEAHRWRNAARAQAPDDAAVEAIHGIVANPVTSSRTTKKQYRRMLGTLLRALDAARARCAEVEADVARMVNELALGSKALKLAGESMERQDKELAEARAERDRAAAKAWKECCQSWFNCLSTSLPETVGDLLGLKHGIENSGVDLYPREEEQK